MKKTKLTKNQAIKKVFRNIYDPEFCCKVDIVVNIRHDDSCGNGHNTFSITGTIYKAGKSHTDGNSLVGGAIGDRINKLIPELAHVTKWHLCSTDGPLHYIANTLYWAKEIPKEQDSYFLYMEDVEFDFKVLLGIYTMSECKGIEKKYPKATITTKMLEDALAKDIDINKARKSAIWENATLEQLQDEEQLRGRLPTLLKEFQRDIESLGLTY